MNKFILILILGFQLLFVLLSFTQIQYQELLDSALYSIYNKYPILVRSYTTNFKEIGHASYCYGPWSCLLSTCNRAININVSMIGNTFPYNINETICKRLKSESLAMNYINDYSLFSIILPLIILAISLEIIEIPIAIFTRKINYNWIKILYSFINITCLILEVMIFVIFNVAREKMFYDLDDIPPIFIVFWYYISQSIIGIILISSHILSIIIIVKKRQEYLIIN